jgi:hypothetical protein
MKLTRRTQRCAIPSWQKSIKPPNALAELRSGQDAFAQAATHLETAALTVRSAYHGQHLARLARLTLEASVPIGRLLRQMERERVLGA